MLDIEEAIRARGKVHGLWIGQAFDLGAKNHGSGSQRSIQLSPLYNVGNPLRHSLFRKGCVRKNGACKGNQEENGHIATKSRSRHGITPFPWTHTRICPFQAFWPTPSRPIVPCPPKRPRRFFNNAVERRDLRRLAEKTFVILLLSTPCDTS